jgi:hypothetical protein
MGHGFHSYFRQLKEFPLSYWDYRQVWFTELVQGCNFVPCKDENRRKLSF